MAETGKPLEKIDINALRTCDTVLVHYNGAGGAGWVHAIKRGVKTEADPFASDQTHILPIEVHIYKNWRADVSRAECWSHITLYPDTFGPEETAIHALKVGDTVVMEFYPDHSTNGYMEAAGLHGDVLRMYVQRNGKTVAQYILDRSISPSTGRLCRHVYRKEDETAAA